MPSVQQLETFQTAVKRIDAKKQIGKLSDVWIAFAKFYEDLGQVDDVSVSVACFDSTTATGPFLF